MTFGEGSGNPLQYSCLGNFMDRRAWQATVHGVLKELDKRLSNITETHTHTYIHIVEKEMATHSSILSWKIPWTEEPGRLPFIGLQRV